MDLFTNSQRYISNELIDTSVERLNNFRNRFIHFMPMSWSLEILVLPKLGFDVINAIEFLLFESGNIYFYGEMQYELVEEIIRELKSELTQREHKYVV